MFIFFFLFVCVRIINKYAVIESLYLTWANRPSQTHPNPNSETIALAFDTKKTNRLRQYFYETPERKGNI